MKKVIQYISLFLVLVSCFPKQKDAVTEIELLNDIFVELIGTEYYYEKLPIPPIPLQYAKNWQDSISHKIQKDKFDEAFNNPKLETKELVLGLDPFHLNSKKEFRSWNIKKSSFPRMYYSDTLHSLDFDQLFTQLVDSTTFKKGKLELNKISQTGKYIIKDLRKLEKQNKKYWNNTDYRFIGAIRFSDFKINPKNDRAVFYFNFTCGSLCGSGEIIFCLKENGKWKIVDRNTLWVS
ncbi:MULTISPECIES: hypothetical protein [Aquimarina]|uniref:hypothetical protein n=1 Tax=Aquimarina TaxID=290174 RepID=UPI000407BA1A|nr:MULTISPECIES: hypothetical protein [Aquimarina]